MQNSLQEKAASAGGFSAPAAALALEELGVGTPAGWLHRGLLLQVCVDPGWGWDSVPLNNDEAGTVFSQHPA